jgi:hypothetical protein
MKNIKFKSGLIFGIIIMLLLTSIVPSSIGQTHTATQQQNITATSLPSTEETSSFTLYVIGKNGLEKQETMLSASNTWRIYEKYQELKKEMTSNPYSDKTQRVQQEFFDLLVENHAIPTGMSKDQLLSLIQPPVIPPKHLRTDIHPFQNKASEWFCNFATFGEGSAFPIIILPRLIPFLLMPIPRAFVWWSTPSGITSVGGLISRTGFLAGGEQQGIALGFWGIGFSIFLPPIMSYGIFGYAVFTRVTAEEFQFYPPNTPPEITQTDPADGQQMVPISTTELRFEIKDANGDLMSYNVTTEPDIGSGSGGLKPDGTYSIPISGLESLTQYTWHIQVTDGKDTTEKTLTFTTEPVAPIISNPSPADGERDVPMDLPQLQFTLKDYQGDTMEYTVQTSPNIGSDHKVGVHDGTYTVPVSGLTYGATYLWYVNVTDGTHWTRKIFSFETGYPSQFDPFEFGWQYRKPITIDHTQVLDDLTNFPVLVSTSDTDLSQKAQVDGGDILFMNDAGISTRVYHDLESYDASSGTLVTWVNIPSLSSNDDTVFYMYYGNPSCINQEYPEKTWDSNYELVYHMNEANLAKIIDSTSNKRNTTSRSASSPSSVNGKSGKAIHFASGNWYIFPCSDIFRGNSDYSVQLWFNADSMSALAYLMILNQYAAINPLILGWNTANNILRTAIRTDYSWSVPVQTTALSTNTWNSVSLTYSTTSGWNLYWNTSSTSNAATSSLDSVSSNNGLGGLWDGTSTFIGTIDEVRISNIVRSAAWIQTSYATMNDPSLFVHIGQEEPGP